MGCICETFTTNGLARGCHECRYYSTRSETSHTVYSRLLPCMSRSDTRALHRLSRTFATRRLGWRPSLCPKISRSGTVLPCTLRVREAKRGTWVQPRLWARTMRSSAGSACYFLCEYGSCGSQAGLVDRNDASRAFAADLGHLVAGAVHITPKPGEILSDHLPRSLVNREPTPTFRFLGLMNAPSSRRSLYRSAAPDPPSAAHSYPFFRGQH